MAARRDCEFGAGDAAASRVLTLVGTRCSGLGVRRAATQPCLGENEMLSGSKPFRRARTRWWPLLAAALIQVVSHATAISGQQQRYAAVFEGILAAWKTADVVCLGEDHGRQFDSDLRIGLIRHPAFSRTVRVIVIEFANPIHQDLLDSFILDGVAMAREELAPIWRDASGDRKSVV